MTALTVRSGWEGDPGRSLRSPQSCVSHAALSAIVLTAVGVATCAVAEPPRCVPGWEAAFGAAGVDGPGLSGPILSLALDSDGMLIAGGAFWSAGGEVANGVARWDGSAWSTLGAGLLRPFGADQSVNALAIHDDGTGPALYAGGVFRGPTTPIYGVARFDGEAWQPVGDLSSWASCVGCGVLAITSHDDGTGAALYAITVADSAPGPVIRWTGSAWETLPVPLVGDARTLIVHDFGDGDELVVGGGAMWGGGQWLSRVARWDGTSWASLEWPNADDVRSLAVHDGGDGQILHAGTGLGVHRLVNGAWEPIGSGSATVHALASFDDGDGSRLYAGGAFTVMTPMKELHPYLSRRDDAVWGGFGVDLKSPKEAGSAVTSPVRALLAVDRGPDGDRALYVGGEFADSVTGDGFIAKWRGCPSDAPLVGDLNGDGVVDGTDLGILLSSWGPCTGCPADLNGDGTVDGTDLGIMLGAWTR